MHDGTGSRRKTHQKGRMKGFMDRSKLAGTLQFTDAIFSVWHLLRRRKGE